MSLTSCSSLSIFRIDHSRPKQRWVSGCGGVKLRIEMQDQIDVSRDLGSILSLSSCIYLIFHMSLVGHEIRYMSGLNGGLRLHRNFRSEKLLINMIN